MSRSKTGQLRLRKATDADLPFLMALRESTMRRYLEQSKFVVNKKTLATRVLDHYESAQIVRLKGRDIGLLKVNRSKNPWDLIQIQLLPQFQRKGLGAKLISAVLTDAAAKGAAVKLSVLRVNPARGLYERLGFKVTRETEAEYFMRWGRQRRVGRSAGVSAGART